MTTPPINPATPLTTQNNVGTSQGNINTGPGATTDPDDSFGDDGSYSGGGDDDGFDGFGDDGFDGFGDDGFDGFGDDGFDGFGDDGFGDDGFGGFGGGSGDPVTGPRATATPLSNTTQTSVNTVPTTPVMTGSVGINGSSPVPTNSASTTPSHTSIAGFSLNPISAQKFGENFLVGWSMTAGTNVTVLVAYNGIPCCNAGPFNNTGGQCDCLISDPNLFDPDGVVNVSAVASNPVSSTPAYIEVEVLKSITQVSFTMLTSYSDFGTGVEGRGSQRNIFPAEHPVKFNCSNTGRFIVHDLAGNYE